MSTSDPLKSGMYTTEFWSMVFSVLVGVLVEFGAIHTANPDALVQALAQVAATLTIAAPVVAYSIGRSKVKAASATAHPAIVPHIGQTAPDAWVNDTGSQPVAPPPPPVQEPTVIPGARVFVNSATRRRYPSTPLDAT